MDSNSEKLELTASIVLYKNDIEVLKKTINSFLKTPIVKKLYLIDNSPTRFFKDKFRSDEIEYIFLNKNVGFGSGHNQVIEKIKSKSNHHLILNPDVVFSTNVIPNLITVLKNEDSAVMVAPKVVYPNGNHQYSCRKFPSLFELMVRRLPLFNSVFKSIIERGEYRDKDLSKPFYAEYISGCFQLYKTQMFVEINGFDERYFMYMEDVDICRKIFSKKKKSLYYPENFIIHSFEKGSSKKIKLFYYHIKSIIQYFYKWEFAK